MQTLFDIWEVCTPENKFKEGMPGRWMHPQAIEKKDAADREGVKRGDYKLYECPICGKTITVWL